MNPIEENAYHVLEAMVSSSEEFFQNNRLQEMTGLSPGDLSDAVDYLGDIEAVEVLKTLGTAPFHFKGVVPKSRGRYLYHEMKNAREKLQEPLVMPKRPLNPIGSPYGFTEDDWDSVSLRKEDNKTLFVVLGKQFKSEYYDSALLDKNIEAMFLAVVDRYNEGGERGRISLQFTSLSAGLGEHLFNEIARDIIGADIATFETSDLNPNVMLEMGVALTWGVRVIPFKAKGCPVPPSDISGQTWVEHEESGSEILYKDFDIKLSKMVERVIAAKGKRLL